MDIGQYQVGKASRYSTKEFFTVTDGDEVHVYERPYGESKRDIRIAIHLAFIEPWDYEEERKVTGRYPNYRVDSVSFPGEILRR